MFKTPGKHSRLWKQWRAIGRGREPEFFLEHSEAVLEALQAAVPPEQVLLTHKRYRAEPEEWEQLAQRNPRVGWYLVEQKDLDKLTSVPSSNGLCGVFSPPPSMRVDDIQEGFILVAWEVQDPGNIGTLIRSCAALTAGAFISVGGCKPWSAKVARSSAGALLRTPIVSVGNEEGKNMLQAIRDKGYQIHCAVPRGGEHLPKVQWSGHDAVVVGNETRGVPIEIQKFTNPLTIGMEAANESLNVAVAGSIACYEWGKRSRVHG